MMIAIDVDNTLLREEDGAVVVNHGIFLLMVAVKSLELADIVVWSGGGQSYAEDVVRRFGLGNLVARCAAKSNRLMPDITIDDQDFQFGRVNLRLPVGDDQPTPYMGMF